MCIRTYEGHSSSVNSATYSSDGRRIVSASGDGTVRIWSTITGKCEKILYNIPGLLCISCDFRQLHVGSNIDKEKLKQYGGLVD